MLSTLLFAVGMAATLNTDGSGTASGAFQTMLECRSISDAQSRLACFDRAASVVSAAQEAGTLLVVEHEQLRQNRKRQFGVVASDPSLLLEGEGGERVDAIATRILSAFQRSDGKWVFDLEESGRWVQIDSRSLSSEPRSGHEIKIRRAAMGSYLANVNGQVAIRVRRSD
jgi:hypothetical protein